VLAKTLGVPLFQEQVMRLAVVAADYTPGEADQLRRDMAAWRRTGKIEQHRQRLIERMERKGIARDFAERVFDQIRGFADYGFPESHAASFALLAYATSWLRCHYHAEFTCALLNSLPMGFYSAATLVGDAIRHGVEVRPIDVAASEWDCTLEARGGGGFAIRMGLRFVKGMREADGRRVAELRAQEPFASVRDFALRTGLDARTQARLAEAGALALPQVRGGAPVGRRDALWQVRGHQREQADTLHLPGTGEAGPELDGLDALQTILWDYQTSAHSTRGHPLAPLRPALAARGLPEAAAVTAMADGRRVDYAGIVICRQRPGTASGVTFMTLEDETGFVNVVVWAQVFERFAALARTASFLGVSGKLQVEQNIVHIIADRLWLPRLPAAPPQPPSRDFH
jgi:error-prone DNA polymerase